MVFWSVKRIGIFLVWVATVWGQSVELGVAGGVPLTSALVTGQEAPHFCYVEEATSATRRYTVGPMLRISLLHGLGFEGGALYKRLGYDSLSQVACLAVFTRGIYNSWEFPLLGTYRLPGHLPGAPFLSGGPSFRSMANASLTAHETYPGGSAVISDSTSVLDRSHAGLAVGIGGEVRAERLRITPELRYTRWRADPSQIECPVLQSEPARAAGECGNPC